MIILGTDDAPMNIVSTAAVFEKVALYAFVLAGTPEWGHGISHAVVFDNTDNMQALAHCLPEGKERPDGYSILSGFCFLTDEKGAAGFTRCKQTETYRIIPLVEGAKLFQEI